MYFELLREINKNKPESDTRQDRYHSSDTSKDVIRMNYNENPYGMSPYINSNIRECNKYQDWYSVNLKQTLADIYKLDISNFVIGQGLCSLITLLGETFLNKDDEIIVGEYSYEEYLDLAYDFEAKIVSVPMIGKNLRYDLDGIKNNITDKTKMIIICNPNNPTGDFIKKDILEKFILSLPKNIIVVIDEAYLEYIDVDGSKSLVNLVSEIEQPIIIGKTFSKIYGLAGMRIGYMIAKPELIDYMSKSNRAWNISRENQKIAIQALKDQDWLNKCRGKNVVELNKMIKFFIDSNIEYIPSFANFIMFKPKNPKELKEKLKENKILINSQGEYLRVSLSTPENNELFRQVITKYNP